MMVLSNRKKRNGVRQPRTVGGVLFDVFNSLLMLIIFVIMFYPFLYVFSYSFSTPSQITNPLLLLPQGFNIRAYTTLFSDADFFQSILISVARTILGPLLMLLVCGMGAYALSKRDLIFGKFLRMMIFFTMYFSAGVIPTYLLIKDLGLTRSFWVYILPNLANAYNVVLLRTYVESLPHELDEAVQIDGGNELQAYFKVIFHVCLPVNAAVVLFSAITHWNSYIDTQFYNSMSTELYTLQYYLYQSLQANVSQSLEEAVARGASASSRVSTQTLKMAITVITVFPIMCLYPFISRYFVSGLLVGSVKA